MRLIHGDSATLTFAQLAEAAGVDIADVDIHTSDVVVFSVADHLAGTVLISVSTPDITFTQASGPTPLSGSVPIAADDWEHVTNLAFRQEGCPWDLQRTRGDSVVTVMEGRLAIVPDVTP